jgi:Mor family transcriptional regulator
MTPPPAGRARIDPKIVAAAYLAGSKLDELALPYEVSTSTIKRVLRNHGTKKYRCAS